MLPNSRPNRRRRRRVILQDLDVTLVRITAVLVAFGVLAQALAMLVGVSNCLKIALGGG